MPFLKLKILAKKLRVGYVYIEESFDNIFNMGLINGIIIWFIGRENRPWAERVNP